MPTIIVVGNPRCGKSLAAKMLAGLTGQKHGETSDPIYAALADRLDVTEAALRACPKEELRPALVEIGDQMCAVKPDALSASLYDAGCRVISGVRRKLELYHFAQRMETERRERVWTVWIWRRAAPVVEDNTTVGPHDADFVVENDGTPAELFEKLSKVADKIKAYRPAKVPEFVS